VLEGAAGWKLGPWSVGATSGYEARDHLSIVSTVVRRVRSVTPGVVVGVSRHIGPVRLGGFARLRRKAETVLLYTRTGSGRVYELSGYREVPLIDLSTSYYKRLEQNSTSFGGTLGGSSERMRWTVYGEGDRQSERLTRQQQNDPAEDQWNESGWSAGGALQRSLGAHWLVTVHGRTVKLSGNGDLALDSAGSVFHAAESALDAQLELRKLAAGKGWTGTLTMGVDHEARTRRDAITALSTSVTSTTSTVGIELGRSLGSRVFAAAGAAVALYGPSSAIPNPVNRGPIYRSYFAPEYAVYSARAYPAALSVLFRYRLARQTELWAAGRFERLASSKTPLATDFLPPGSRTASSIIAGITVLSP
jgi:hypothetical protein